MYRNVSRVFSVLYHFIKSFASHPVNVVFFLTQLQGHQELKAVARAGRTRAAAAQGQEGDEGRPQGDTPGQSVHRLCQDTTEDTKVCF